MATLLLMRHAKSDWEAEYGRDHERPLNARGERSARLMGRLLAHEGLVPDLVVSSSATRAASTAHLAAAAGGWRCPIRLERALYDGGPDTVLGVVSEAAGGLDRVLVVGHQPTWGFLARRLTGEPVDVRTATVVVVDVSGLDDLLAGGSLREVYHPRDHFGGPFDGG